MRYFLAVLFASLMVSPVHAKGALTFDRCKVYFADSQGVPGELKSYFVTAPYDAVEVCSHFVFPGGFSYEARSEVMRAAGNVCLFTEHYVFQDDKGGWEGHAPERLSTFETGKQWTYMTVADGPCPRQDSETYSNGTRVSAESFAEVAGYWRGIATEPTKRDDLIARLEKADPYATPHFLPYLEAVNADTYLKVMLGVGKGPRPGSDVVELWLDGHGFAWRLDLVHEGDSLVPVDLGQVVP